MIRIDILKLEMKEEKNKKSRLICANRNKKTEFS